MSLLDVLAPRVDRLHTRDGGLYPPPKVLLSWPAPNYVDPEERGWGSSVVLLIFLGIAFLFYVARIWARLGQGKTYGLDDTIMSMAMLPLFGLTISVVLGEIFVFHQVYVANNWTRHSSLRLSVARLGSDESVFNSCQRG